MTSRQCSMCCSQNRFIFDLMHTGIDSYYLLDMAPNKLGVLSKKDHVQKFFCEIKFTKHFVKMISRKNRPQCVQKQKQRVKVWVAGGLHHQSFNSNGCQVRGHVTSIEVILSIPVGFLLRTTASACYTQSDANFFFNFTKKKSFFGEIEIPFFPSTVTDKQR